MGAQIRFHLYTSLTCVNLSEILYYLLETEKNGHFMPHIAVLIEVTETHSTSLLKLPYNDTALNSVYRGSHVMNICPRCGLIPWNNTTNYLQQGL